MAHSKVKQKTHAEKLAEHAERIDREQPIIRSRWYVVEQTPSVCISDEYGDRWTDVRIRQVSGYYNSREGAVAWIEHMEPEKGNHFTIGRDNLRQISQWVRY